MKYARIERERRFLLSGLPEGVQDAWTIADWYLPGLRLRLRRMESRDQVVCKLGQKFRPDPSAPHERQMTTLYLEQAELTRLVDRLASDVRPMRKQRYHWPHDGLTWSVDAFEAPHDALVIAEVECDTAHALAAIAAPPGTLREVTSDPTTDGAVLAAMVDGLRHGDTALRMLGWSDVPRMARWLSDPVVLEFYEGRDRPWTEATAHEELESMIRREDDAVPCIIEHGGQPVGYLQYYAVADPADYELDDATATFAMDLFIGEPTLWGRGVGTAALQATLRMLFESAGALRVVIDPIVSNVRAQRAYEKVGFRKVKVLEKHELHEGEHRDSWLMELRRRDWPV